MSRTLPTECGHGYIADWGDFADDGDGPEHCPAGCNDTAYSLTEAAAQIAHLTECLKALDAENERLRAENARLRATPTGAWFGAWECGCSDTERTPVGIPELCPNHGRRLISNFAGQTKVQLNHSGVSGYGFHAGPRGVAGRDR